ncbi:hypothetical protein JB92DRAFT_2826579 [Gautieria morchelliformis]|nr:hypothetical protein JB92DRAFT_2826579 [Gautieria morchelliformis]
MSGRPCKPGHRVIWFFFIRSLVLGDPLWILSMDPWESTLRQLTISDIFDVIPRTHFTRAAHHSKEVLVREASAFTGELRDALRAAVQLKGASTSRKRKRDVESDVQSRTSHRVADGADSYSSNAANFMLLPTAREVHHCQWQFYDATSNQGVQESVCVACARRLWAYEGELRSLQDVVNVDLLRPSQPHPAHDSYEGLLLIKEYLIHPSMGALVKNKVPSLALANQMWIGRVPLQLRQLTIPKQMLVAFHYPRCFVFKLFPKNGSPGDPDTLQRGLAGNVTTYALNMPDIVRMLEGDLMPRPAQILASVIAVTFIGVGTVPKCWLSNTFRVFRAAVLEALLWLRANNAMYHDVAISEDRLQSLPVDGVPDEILANFRQEDDPGLVDRERETYVPPSDADGARGRVCDIIGQVSACFNG